MADLRARLFTLTVASSADLGSRSAVRHLPPRTAVRERVERSQVTELLTDVRSGRRRYATLCIISNYQQTTYTATPRLAMAEACQNGIDSNARANDLSLRLVDSRIQVAGLIPRVAASTLRFFKIALSNHRFARANRQFELPNCRVETWIFENRGLKSPIPNLKSTGRNDRLPVCNHPLAHGLMLQTRKKRESSLRLVPSHGRCVARSCIEAQQTPAGPNSPICRNTQGEHHGKIPNPRS